MVRRAFAASVVLLGAVIAVSAAVLPDRVPVHFGPGLDADRYGSRSELLLGVGAAGLLVALVFAGSVWLIQRLPVTAMNVPHAAYWKAPENQSELRRRFGTDMLVMGAATMVLLAGELALATRAAVTGADRLSPWSVAILALYLGFVAGWCLWLARWRFRPPGDATA